MKLFLDSINDSFTLIAFRISSVSWVARILGAIFIILSFFAIGGATRINNLLRDIMMLQLDDNPSSETTRQLQQFVSIYLGMYADGDMATFVSISSALLLGSIIFVPFSGYVIHGVISHSEMVIVKNGDNYKIGDSVLFQVISSFTIVQLLGLTVVSQLLTFDSPNGSLATVFVWSIWVLMTLITVFFSWVVEYVARRYGQKTRIMFLGSFILALAAMFLLDPNHGTTLFGASPHIFNFIQQLGSGDWNLFFTALAIVGGLCVFFIYLLSFMASQTLILPEPLTISKTNEKQIKNISIRPITPLSMLSRLLFRYTTVTKPIFTALAFSLVLSIILKGTAGLSTVMIVLPLAVAISFGANIFGLVSGSLNWLLTINGWKEKMLHSAAILILGWIVALYALIIGTGLLFGSMQIDDVMRMIPAFISTTSVTVLISIYLSIKYPLPFSGKARENLISSPVKLMIYVGVMLMSAGSAGNITYYLPDFYGWTVAFTIVFVCAASYYLIHRKWMNSEKYTQIMLKETINAG